MAVSNHDNAGPPAGDELDALFGYDVDDDLMRSLDPANNRGNDATANENRMLDAGIDEEVKVKKARKPVAKLDEERLLSQSGIPKLRRITKDRLKLKGKGHEFSDVTRILNLYQLWLDDLYPRAKFTDGLTMIEKLGHTKRMQVMRKAWIDEGKPRERMDVDEIVVSGQEQSGRWGDDPGVIANTAEAEVSHEDEDLGDDLFVRDTTGASAAMHEEPADDELNVLLAEASSQHQTTQKGARIGDGDDVPDDLDELLAEEPAPQMSEPKAARNADDDFADEMEAMGDAW